MSKQRNSEYARLVKKMAPRRSEEPDPEEGLDALITQFQQKRELNEQVVEEQKTDPIQKLRETLINEYIPTFIHLTEKYGQSGIAMEMDASNLLQGGRELKFSFSIGGYRHELLGTATSEAIAFHETRFNPDHDGELASGPLLRLRRLNVHSFRQFICNQLSSLVRHAMRRM
ncbi:MAG: hypothetical protein ACPGXK_16385 [Phycisphaerae bacterium]